MQIKNSNSLHSGYWSHDNYQVTKYSIGANFKFTRDTNIGPLYTPIHPYTFMCLCVYE